MSAVYKEASKQRSTGINLAEFGSKEKIGAMAKCNAGSFQKMKALAEGGVLLRSGRFISLENRTNYKQLVA